MTNFKAALRQKVSLLCCLLFLFQLLFAFPSLAATAANKVQKTASADVNLDELIVDPELKKERQIGRRTVEQIEKEWPLIAEPARLTRLKLILSRLNPYMEREIPYEVRIVNTEAINAFCISGGFIFFTSGLLDILSTDAEIAAIMAHEMIHADQKHSLRMAAKSNKVTLATLAAMLLSGGAAAPIILAQVAQVAITNSYSIEFEKEADSMGLDALIKAGYPPSAMLTVMEKFCNQELRQPIIDYGIYMTHPEAKERVQSTTQRMEELGLKIMRKQPLGVLRTKIETSKGRLTLMMDKTPIWSGKNTPEVQKAFEATLAILDENFQMETAPYDLRLEGDCLFLKNIILAQKTPGAEDLSSLRTGLLQAQGQAKRDHPMAKYFH
ncbi:MAG: M48 family metalloprotease [Fretibacterium sp.]|nr:M48 family metalloprotease [Fretibacterium sp.]